MRSLRTKLLLAGVSAVLLTSSAFAAPQRVRYGDLWMSYGGAAPANYVVARGRIVGADPDPQIRYALQREWDSLHGE